MSVSQFFLRFWWAILLLLFSYSFYVHGMETKRKIFQELKEKAVLLQRELEVAERVQEDLLMQLKSQEDPHWIEMLMMKELGMVPNGQVKVYFEE